MGLMWGVLGAVVTFAQTDQSPEEVREEAVGAFERGDWELAHRRLAELLSLDGTNRELQVWYAATLLHDARLREEGIQRLAALANEGVLNAEGWHWWGKALLLQGEGKEAELAFEKALAQAGKKDRWRSDAELGLRQSQSLPASFATRQKLSRLDALDVPKDSYHRYVQWDRQGVRLMLVPAELASKRDKKEGVIAPVTFWRGQKEVFFHSLGAKGEQGLDLWVGQMDSNGEFSEAQRLPESVNSKDDDMHPVWDPESQCLHFASNRPGTVGGLDIFKTCRVDGVWEQAKPLGPLYNSVHDEWAYYPPSASSSGWLLTGREAAYGGTQVWEVMLDGEPESPVLLTTNWVVDGESVPGVLTLFDAESDETLAQLELTEPSGAWDLVVGSGQVVRYSFVTESGQVMEGTYALPDVSGPSALTQRMVMTLVDGEPFLDARPVTKKGTSQPNLTWGWDLVTNETVVPEWRPLPAIVDPEVVEAVLPVQERPVKQFQSYPWWTEVQREERALAAHVLSSFLPEWEPVALDPTPFETLKAYEEALLESREEVMSRATEALLSLAAADVLLNETPWSEAFDAALRRADALWPVGTLNVENVARQAQRRWASGGSMYDQGVLPEVRDKRSLVGDGEWVELPWKRGEVAALAQQHARVAHVRPEAVPLVWSLAHQPDATEAWGDAWLSPSMWDPDSSTLPRTSSETKADEREEESELRNALTQIRTRMGVLEAMEPTEVYPEALRTAELRRWTALALDVSSRLDVIPHPVEPDMTFSNATEDLTSNRGERQPEGPSGVAAKEASTFSDSNALRESWGIVWNRQLESWTEKAQQGWRSEYIAWLKNVKDEVWSPDSLLVKAQDDWEAQQEKGLSASSETVQNERPVDEAGKQELLDNLRSAMDAGMDEEEAQQMLSSAWLLLRWMNDEEWSFRSPDEVLALQSDWPMSVRQGLERQSISWAKQEQMNVPELADEPEGVRTEEPLSSETAALREEPVENSGLKAQTEGDSAPFSSLALGDVGLHLGWFRNEPDVADLPAGTRLVSEEGSQGLTRWILVLPPDMKEMDMGGIQAWLGRRGVADAHEVYWHGKTWEKLPAVPPTAATAQGNESESNNSDLDSSGEPSENSAPDEASEESSAVARDGTPDETFWGGDEVWEHGAPVELGNLLGTWYAVQVGAFRGQPKKEWIEKAGERLVYEPFPDGLARWYAGVRQDEASAWERWEELKSFEPFADAFVVRLRNGEREVIRPGEPEGAAEAVAEGDSEVTRDLTGDSLEDTDPRKPQTENGLETAPTALENPALESTGLAQTEAARPEEDPVPAESQIAVASAEIGASLAQASELEPSRWHIDISKYYGTVPSKDVAALLIRAADWGVRSVELFGQTTYSTRSFEDLAEAERVLEEVRREGFTHAQLVKE